LSCSAFSLRQPALGVGSPKWCCWVVIVCVCVCVCGSISTEIAHLGCAEQDPRVQMPVILGCLKVIRGLIRYAWCAFVTEFCKTALRSSCVWVLFLSMEHTKANTHTHAQAHAHDI
jgi:hypothetical protein